LSVLRAGNRSRGEAHVEVGRPDDEGEEPRRDGELEPQVLLVAEPELEP